MKNGKYLLSVLMIMMCLTTGSAQSYKVPANEMVKGETVINTVTVTGASELHLGRYELYSGIPSMYLGHFILLASGKYKVAFNTDETNYDESGTYVFHSDTNTIEWKSGMFKNNNWRGEIKKTDAGFRIQFNKATYADSK